MKVSRRQNIGNVGEDVGKKAMITKPRCCEGPPGDGLSFGFISNSLQSEAQKGVPTEKQKGDSKTTHETRRGEVLKLMPPPSRSPPASRSADLGPGLEDSIDVDPYPVPDTENPWGSVSLEAAEGLDARSARPTQEVPAGHEVPER